MIDQTGYLSTAFGLERREFDAAHRGRAFLRGRLPSLTEASPLDWRGLGALVDIANAQGALKLVRDQQRLQDSHYCRKGAAGRQEVVSSALARALNKGYTIVLDGLEAFHSPSRDIAEGLTRELGEIVSINAYISWLTHQAFVTHWDDHDVLVIQTDGEKDWTVYRPTREAPLRFDVQAPPKGDFELVWTGRLSAGDVLYIPRGWWHHAVSANGGSIHLTCGFTSRTGIDFIRYVTDLACQSATFRRDLDRTADGQRLIDDLIGLLRSDTAASIIEAFWRDHHASLPLKRRHAFPTLLDPMGFLTPDDRLQLAINAPEMTFEAREESVVVEAGERRWELHPHAKDLLAEFGAAPRVAGDVMTAVSNKIDRPTAEALIDQLVIEGLLVVCLD